MCQDFLSSGTCQADHLIATATLCCPCQLKEYSLSSITMLKDIHVKQAVIDKFFTLRNPLIKPYRKSHRNNPVFSLNLPYCVHLAYDDQLFGKMETIK